MQSWWVWLSSSFILKLCEPWLFNIASHKARFVPRVAVRNPCCHDCAQPTTFAAWLGVAWRAVVDPTKRHLQSTLLEPTAAAKEKEALKNLGDDAQAAYAVASLMAKRRRGRGRRVEDIAPRE